MTIKEQLVLSLTVVVKELGITDVIPSISYPPDSAQGDYASNVALVVAKKLGRNPMDVAEEIMERFKVQNPEFTIAIAKPGFLNFRVPEEMLIRELSNPAIPQIGKGKKVVVEYSSTNIAKPFIIGHLRSTIIGDAVANLLDATGFEVHRDNHVGDWGTQFGKQIYAIKTWGNEEEIEKSDRPVKLLVQLYVKFHEEAEKNPELEDKAREWFKKLEDGDPEARRLWQKCVDWSWQEFESIYEELGVTFTENSGRGYGESFFEDKMAPVIADLKKKGLLEVGKEGAQIVSFPEQIKLPPLMILKKDGASLYSTRDLATDRFRRQEYGDDVVIINEVGAEQELYFRQLFKLEEMLGWFKDGQRVHIKHGLVRFRDQKMSTRKGNIIWLEDVLEEAEKRAFQLAKESFKIDGSEAISTSKKYSKSAQKHIKGVGISLNVQKMVSIGAIKWNDLKRSPEQDIVFDWDELLNMQGNSGPYMQYAFVRTKSILDKSGVSNFKFLTSNLVLEPEERALLRLLARFGEVVHEAAERLAPHLLCSYLFAVAQAFNTFYQACQILKASEELRVQRLFLTSATGEVIKRGLDLLGIQAPEKM